jgi:hypothetical protein
MVTRYVEPALVSQPIQPGNGNGTVVLDGKSLTITDITRVARYGAKVRLTEEEGILDRVESSGL